jgi:hypothetical protein
MKLFYCLSLLGIFAALSNTALANYTFGGDEYTLTAKHSGKCLDVAWFSMVNEGDIVQSHCSGTNNQIWRIYWGQLVHPLHTYRQAQ